MNFVSIEALILILLSKYCHSIEVIFKKDKYEDDLKKTLFNCTAKLKPDKELFANMTIKKDGQIFYYFDDANKNEPNFTKVPGIDTIALKGPGLFVIQYPNKTTAGTYKCSVGYLIKMNNNQDEKSTQMPITVTEQGHIKLSHRKHKKTTTVAPKQSVVPLEPNDHTWNFIGKADTIPTLEKENTDDLTSIQTTVKPFTESQTTVKPVINPQTSITQMSTTIDTGSFNKDVQVILTFDSLDYRIGSDVGFNCTYEMNATIHNLIMVNLSKNNELFLSKNSTLCEIYNANGIDQDHVSYTSTDEMLQVHINQTTKATEGEYVCAVSFRNLLIHNEEFIRTSNASLSASNGANGVSSHCIPITIATIILMFIKMFT